MFDYDKWLHPKLKNKSGKAAIPAISATKKSENSKNSGNSDSNQIDLKKLRDFLGEDWLLYKDDPKALTAWNDLLYEQQLMRQGVVPDNFTDIVYCQSCQQHVYSQISIN